MLTLKESAKKLGKNPETLRRWVKQGLLKGYKNPDNGYLFFNESELEANELQLGLDFYAKSEQNSLAFETNFSTIELFAGAGGLALGLEKAGLHCIALNEIDAWACKTLKYNRPSWNVLEGDIKHFNFKQYKDKADVVTGGFPCQAFSYAGKKRGLEDTRGTLFYEFLRVVNEVNPKIVVGENVRGLLTHDGGRTIEVMIKSLEEIGYRVLPVKILKAIHFMVPQKRERIILVGIRKDIELDFKFPIPLHKIYTLKDALKKGELYDSDVPQSKGSQYPNWKKEILNLVPPGGYWRDLPYDLQVKYLAGSFHLGGGKTGIARRIGWDEPCLTLTCSPAQKQTERCHPEETRPFTIREYARIQTFPDDWQFQGSLAQQYKQIGNAVPVNLGLFIGNSIKAFLAQYYAL